MISFSTIKTLGGAVALRTWETYKLLITRFWWLLALIYLINEQMDILTPLWYVLHPALTLFLISVIILLSRSSMVRKDWHYVFMSSQTMGMLLWYVGWLIMVSLLSLIPDTPFSIVPKLSRAELFFGTLFIFAAPTLMMLWVYVLLDSKITCSNILYIIPQSLRSTGYLLWNNPRFLPLLFIICLLAFFFSTLVLFVASTNFLLPTFLFFPLYAALVAVMYEEMRYRSGV